MTRYTPLRSHCHSFIFFVVSLAAMLCLTSCGNDDDGFLDAYTNALGEFRTDHNGKVQTFRLDDGTGYSLTNDVSGLTADSVYRVQALYIAGEDRVTITQYVEVLAPMPRQIEESKQKTDPVNVSAFWNGGRYVNLRLALLTQGNTHYFTFIDQGTDTHEDGTRVKRIMLYHDQNGNGTYYTRELFMSCPVYQYAGDLQSGKDSLALTIHTYEGEKTYKTRLAF